MQKENEKIFSKLLSKLSVIASYCSIFWWQFRELLAILSCAGVMLRSHNSITALLLLLDCRWATINLMARVQKNASVLQTLFISYLMISIPAAGFAYYMVKSVDDELSAHVAVIQSGKLDSLIGESESLLSFGAFLRKHSAPFSKTDNDHLYDKTDQSHNWTENLRNARTAIIYCWIILILSGSFVYLALATNLQRTFKRLATAIDSLRKPNAANEIRLDVPFELTDVSTSLENLRLKMTHEDVQQQRFLRHISHEIKTPLASIKEGSKLLDEQVLGEMNSEQHEITNILVRSSADLQRAVENLLDYNEAVAFKQAIQRKPLDLAELARQALSNNELAIKQKQLLVNAQIEACHGNVDQNRILAVFDNLISNAIKHSPVEGSINIRLEKKGFREIIFLIQDQGPGISEQDEKFIFTPFYVGAQATETTLKGTGLGLSIAKQYVDEHKGILSLVKNRKGAVFKVVLPSN